MSKTFETALKAFTRSTKTAEAAAKDCSDLAIEHFWKGGNGDTSQLAAFSEAVRGTRAFRANMWLMFMIEHCPVKLEKGEIKIDKEHSLYPLHQKRKQNTDAITARVAMAKSETWFDDGSNAKAPTVFTEAMLLQRVVKIVTKVANADGEKVKADDAATKVAADLLDMIGNKYPEAVAEAA